tara:strand:+ start:56029 stop:57129 length:1101 start_codon:yes stop_codon:yes gene_type:complete
MDNMDLITTTENNSLGYAFFEAAFTPCIILDKDLFFVAVNQAAASCMKTTRDNLPDKHLLEVFPNLADTDYYHSFMKVIETGISMSLKQIPCTIDKNFFQFSIKIFKLNDGIGITALDITQLTQKMDDLQEKKLELEHINQSLIKRNQELEELSFITAHDLKAPLANLYGLHSLLLSENAISESGMFLFEKIKLVTKVMTDKLHALSQIIALKSHSEHQKKDLHISDVLDKIKVLHTHEIIKSGAVFKEDFKEWDTILYDPIHFESVLQNFISNAIKYRHPKRSPMITLKTSLVANKKVLTITDNGIGFDGNVAADKIFGLFKRMHTHVEGLGVGLYMANTILHNNGGFIEVAGKINEGAEFKLYF